MSDLSRFMLHRWRAAALLGSVLLGASACTDQEETAEQPPPENTVYQVRGIVRGVDPKIGSLSIHHEEIPGYMPSMVMPFNLRNPEMAASYTPGQAVAFDFVVTEDDSWITNIRELDPAESPGLPATRGGAVAPSAGPRLDEGDAVPDFRLVRQNGTGFDRDDLGGQPTVLTFIFTRCPVPNYCPLMSRQFAELQEAIKQDPELGGVQLVSVTIDPEFDTPEVLAEYAEQFGADAEVWTFLTGQPAQIDRLAGAFAVHRKPEGGSITHSLTTALIDRSGVVRKIWRGNFWKPDDVLGALRKHPRPKLSQKKHPEPPHP